MIEIIRRIADVCRANGIKAGNPLRHARIRAPRHRVGLRVDHGPRRIRGCSPSAAGASVAEWRSLVGQDGAEVKVRGASTDATRGGENRRSASA